MFNSLQNPGIKGAVRPFPSLGQEAEISRAAAALRGFQNVDLVNFAEAILVAAGYAPVAAARLAHDASRVATARKVAAI